MCALIINYPLAQLAICVYEQITGDEVIYFLISSVCEDSN